MTRRPHKPPPEAAVQVPVWVVIFTYLLCWTGAGYTLIHEVQGSFRSQAVILAVFLVFFPASGVNPARVVKALLEKVGA